MFKKIFKYLFPLIVVAGVSSALLVNFYVMPKVDHLIENYEPVEPAIIYDVKDREVDKIYTTNRELTIYEELPDYLIKAFIVTEDRSFFTHNGFDFLGIVRAAFTNLVLMRKAQGASTITQQLAKNAFLSHTKSFKRKIAEAIITVQIERKYTKRAILEKYLNEIYFGRGVHGVKTAARYFFNKNIKDVTIAEAAFLAAIPKNPSNSFEKKSIRQKYILDNMQHFKFISDEKYDMAKKEELKVFPRYEAGKVPAFTDIVVQKVKELFPNQELTTNGMKIYTALDLDVQKAAQEALSESKFMEPEKMDGAIVSIDSHTGYVKAIVGGKNYKTGYFNKAIRAFRQPGSSFKPLVYLSVLEKGYPMNLVVEDSFIDYGGWTPGNYNNIFDGNFTLVNAILLSKNIVTIKLLQKATLPYFMDLCKKTGIETKLPRNLTIALGTASLNVLEMARANAVFSNGGYNVEPIFITRIEDKGGNIIYSQAPKIKKVFDDKHVAMALYMAKYNMENSNFYRKYKKVRHIPKAGKPGTSNDFVDAWFIGFTSDMSTALFAGMDDNSPIGKDMFGATISGSIYMKFLEKLADSGYNPSEFDFLERYLTNNTLQLRKIDNKTGMLTEKGSTTLFLREQLPCERVEKYDKGLDWLK